MSEIKDRFMNFRVIIIAILIFGCSESPVIESLSDEEFSVTELENVESEPWSIGNFFTTNKEVIPPSSLDQVKEMLSSLKDQGFKFEKAWFNEGASSCGMLAVVVPSQTVIKVDEYSFGAVDPVELEKFNQLFKPTAEEVFFWCPRKVYEIIPSS
ncbi:MAG: hypothetical protein JJ892_09490 [Balneola sp.]|nr:hypothetical protein [Balneola sp.]MBO6800498.1 hypothetical protein [Balneola sp.]MBO6871452.1 hypothetical protein [Balneola sp.]